MKAPKLLPWYARKAGVSNERAEVLWRKAVRKATAETGWVGNAEYWGAAMENFRDLLAQENSSLCTPNMAEVMRMQHRAMRLPLTIFEDLSAATAANWQRFCNTWHRAA